MKKLIYIAISLLTFVGNVSISHAFVIFDGATKVTHVAERITEIAKKAEETISAKETELKSSRIGKMGAEANKYYKEASSFFRKKRKLSDMKLPSYMSEVATSVDDIYKKVEKNYMPKVWEGDSAAVKNKQKRHNLEIQHNQISDAYAKAFAIRNTLVKERSEKKNASQGGQSNSRELIELGRAYNEKMAQRYVDILNMEATILDMENSYILMSSDPQRLERARETQKKGSKK